MNNQTTRLENVNDWLQVVATVGVIASIVFLGFELKQNSELMKAQIYQSRAETLQSAFLELSESEFLVPILIKINTVLTR